MSQLSDVTRRKGARLAQLLNQTLGNSSESLLVANELSEADELCAAAPLFVFDGLAQRISNPLTCCLADDAAPFVNCMSSFDPRAEPLDVDRSHLRTPSGQCPVPSGP